LTLPASASKTAPCNNHRPISCLATRRVADPFLLV
jgi:hypothetical protein